MSLKDVDYRVMAYFQQIFHTPPSDEVLNTFRKFHASPLPHHKETVQCMVKYLIRDYEIFLKYPVGNLMKIANFIGGFIEHGLISDKNSLNTILSYIFYDLKWPTINGNTFNFSLTALKRFKRQLKDFPKLCFRLQRINDFENFPTDLIEFIEYGVNGLEPPTRRVAYQQDVLSSTVPTKEVTRTQAVIFHAQSSIVEPAVIISVEAEVSHTPKPRATIPAEAHDVSYTPELPADTPTKLCVSNTLKLAATKPVEADISSTKKPPVNTPTETNIPHIPNILVTTAVKVNLPQTQKPPVMADIRIIVPSKIVQGKIRSIINYLSIANVQNKVREIKNLITDEHLPWVSRYLVAKRVRHEFNFHHLYSSVLDCWDSKLLNSLVFMETLRKIKILLRRNIGVPSLSDKLLIKNLGHWLEVITLARNKLIPKEEINLEDLLDEANQKGEDELLFVVKFVTQILESCTKGDFGPDNPWTSSIINCLFELYEKPNTNLQVQVEIEKLCKSLKMKLKINRINTKNIPKYA